MKEDSLNFLPVPREVRLGDAIVSVDPGGEVELAAGAGERLRRAVDRWVTEVREEFARPGEAEPRAGSQTQRFLRVRLAPEEIGEQGYTLTLGRSGAELAGGDEAGVFYGLQTWRQILRQPGAALPELEIRDYPDFRNRGYMLDVSRCKVPRMDSLYALIDRLAELKYNQLQLYMEHTFAFPGHEVVWKDASPFTGEEIEAIDAYCRDRYIELVPNLNSFGHMERWLRHPEYHYLAESPEGFVDPWGTRRPYGSVLKPNEDSLVFLDGLYREFLPHFSSPRFNIGCDETWELGQGWSRSQVEEKGAARVYLDFLLRIQNLVHRHGRKVQFWGDIILKRPESVTELPPSVTGMLWGYEADHPFEANCGAFASAGVPFYVVPGTSAWKTLLGRVDNCRANLESAAASGLRHGAAGFLVTDWGDAGHHQFFPISLPGLAYGAALSWNLEGNRGLDLAAALDRHLFLLPDAGLGEVLLDLGCVYRETHTLTDQSTVFHHLLFGDRERLDSLAKEADTAAWERTGERLDGLANRLRRTRPRCPDGELMIDELAANLRLAQHGLRRGLFYAGSGAGRANTLRADLGEIIDLFETLWLKRARPGGLPESLQYLRATRDGYGGGGE